MNLRDLHYVAAVAEHLNFKRAAEACNVSQPTLSMQIRKLEDYLGIRLFERTNKSVMITEPGSRIAEIARRIAHEEGQIREIAQLARDPSAGEFRLGAIPTLASYIFPRYVPALSRDFPQLQLFLVEEKTEVLLERLKAGRVDAALLALPVEEAGLEAVSLFDDPFYLAVGPGHEFSKKKSVHIDDLAGNRLLLLDEGHCLRDQALAVCRTHGAREEKGFRATSLETLRLMVQTPRSGFMTLMPRVAMSEHDQLHYIPFVGRPPSREIGIVWRKAAARSGMIETLAQKLKSLKHAT